MELEEFDKFLKFLRERGYGDYKRSSLREKFLEYLLRKKGVNEKDA